MSILHDETQRAIAEETRRVLRARHDKDRLLALLDKTGAVDEGFRDTAKAQGWHAIAIPEDCGGIGLGLVELGLVAQEIGGIVAGAPFLTPGHAAAQALLAGGDAALCELWLPRLASGEASAAVAFPGGVPAQPEVRLSHGALSGRARGISAGLGADVALVWAAADSGPVLALADLAGTSRHAIDSFDNGRLFADIAFAQTPAAIIAQGEEARSLAHDLLARMAIVAAHEQVGGAEALMLMGRDYALERRAFGQPIGAFQSVKHRIAELYGLVEIARANCHYAATRTGAADFLIAAAAARLSASDAYDTAVRDVVQIHGGIGVAWETGLHIHTRRARSLAIEHGNMLFWEDLLVDELARETA